MARPAIKMADLMPKADLKLANVVATGSLDGLINFKLKKIPNEQILAKFESAINRASAQIAVDLKQALDLALTSPIWAGQDIVDTGNLLRSGRVTIGKNGVTIAYEAPYAALVHYGGYIHPYGNVNLRVYMPPRPWVESVLYGGAGFQPFDFVGYYGSEIVAEINK